LRHDFHDDDPSCGRDHRARDLRRRDEEHSLLIVRVRDSALPGPGAAARRAIPILMLSYRGPTHSPMEE
jgi:hypothetical protein